MCARANVPHPWLAKTLQIKARQQHTIFQRNPPCRSRYIEKEYARAHVQLYPIYDLLKTLRIIGLLEHTKFQRNPFSRSWDMKQGCTRAHVPMCPADESCKTLTYFTPRHIPNLSTIFRASPELELTERFWHPLTRHAPRAMMGTDETRYWFNTG